MEARPQDSLSLCICGMCLGSTGIGRCDAFLRSFRSFSRVPLELCVRKLSRETPVAKKRGTNHEPDDHSTRRERTIRNGYERLANDKLVSKEFMYSLASQWLSRLEQEDRPAAEALRRYFSGQLEETHISTKVLRAWRMALFSIVDSGARKEVPQPRIRAAHERLLSMLQGE